MEVDIGRGFSSACEAKSLPHTGDRWQSIHRRRGSQSLFLASRSPCSNLCATVTRKDIADDPSELTSFGMRLQTELRDKLAAWSDGRHTLRRV